MEFVFTRSPNHLKELSAAQLESVCRVTTAKLAISLQLNANKLKDSARANQLDCVISYFFSTTFNTPSMCPKIQCDG